MIATTKIFYSLVAVPALLFMYDLVLFLVFIFKADMKYKTAFQWTCLFSVIFPIYLYIGIVEYDDLKDRLRHAWLRLYFFFWNRKEGIQQIQEITKMKVDVDKELALAIKKYSKTLLQDELKDPILNRRWSQPDEPSK